MVLAYDKKLEDWVSRGSYQAILDGYFIYDEISETLVDLLRRVDPTGNFSVFIDGSVSPGGNHRGLAIAGQGKSDIDGDIVIGTFSKLSVSDARDVINQIRSNNVRIRRGFTYSGINGIKTDMLYSLSNIHFKVQRDEDFYDWLTDAIRKFYMNEPVELEYKSVRRIPAEAVLNYYDNSVPVYDGIGLEKVIDGYLENVRDDRDFVLYKKDVRINRMNRIKNEHFAKLSHVPRKLRDKMRPTRSVKLENYFPI